MMFLLNRLRGRWSLMAKVTGLALVIFVTLLIPYTHMMQFSIDGWFSFGMANDVFYGLATGLMYVAGESMGWGKWIGGVHAKYELPETKHMMEDREGRKNGIHFLANLISPSTVNYYRYCFTALNIRGIYWFGITLLPLVFGGYLQINDYIAITLLLGYGFPLSVKLGTWVEKKRNEFGTGRYWEYAEYLYGFMQDLAFASIVVLMQTNT